jgi:hypothetical protein
MSLLGGKGFVGFNSRDHGAASTRHPYDCDIPVQYPGHFARRSPSSAHLHPLNSGIQINTIGKTIKATKYDCLRTWRTSTRIKWTEQLFEFFIKCTRNML